LFRHDRGLELVSTQRLRSRRSDTHQPNSRQRIPSLPLALQLREDCIHAIRRREYQPIERLERLQSALKRDRIGGGLDPNGRTVDDSGAECFQRLPETRGLRPGAGYDNPFPQEKPRWLLADAGHVSADQKKSPGADCTGRFISDCVTAQAVGRFFAVCLK
jgi:hypothetical protein